jgi:hypothetical protein
MALQDSDNKYYKIHKVVGLNSTNSPIDVYIEVYKDKNTRDNFGEFDSKKIDTIRVTMDQSDMDAFIAKIYTKIKSQAPYNVMSDVD